MTLTPAYGRDYSNAKQIKADFEANKDFLVADFFSPWDGKAANKDSLANERSIMIRYAGLRKIVKIR